MPCRPPASSDFNSDFNREFDSDSEPAIVSPRLRGNTPRRRYSYILAANGRELSVTVAVERSRGDEVWSLVGEALHLGGGDCGGLEVRLLQNGRPHSREMADAAGQFSRTLQGAGPWQLHLRDETTDWGTIPVFLP